MIDRQSFDVGMGALAERFRGGLAPEAQRGYYAILGTELDTEQFQVAVQLAFRHSQFWPSPQQLIDFAKPPVDLEQEATEMFDRVMDCGVNHPTAGRIWPRAEVEKLGLPALAGYVAVGANEGLRNLSGERLSFARRDFVKAYVSRAKRKLAELEVETARQLVAPRARRLSRPTPLAATVQRVVAESLKAVEGK